MDVAIIVPCHNEELTIGKVVSDCRKYLPEASIFVFDNRSSDQTSALAKKAGASVVFSPLIGKGNAIRHALQTIQADVYVIVDGDDTYQIESIRDLVRPIIEEGFDMVVGARLGEHSDKAFRRFHLFGNRFFSYLVSFLFGQKVSDILSGYRALSNNFAKSILIQSGGFEIETELTLQAISRKFPVKEVELPYRERPEGSHSKLKTFDDGFLILKFIARLIRDYKPLPFFTVASAFCFLFGVAAGWAPIHDYVQFSYVYTVPRAILAGALMILSTVLFGVGLIMDSQVRLFQQQMQMMSALRMQKENSPEAREKRHVA